MLRTRSPGYQLFMLGLSLYALSALLVEVAFTVDPEVRVILDLADYAVCAVFLVDFVISLVTAENRWKYMATWGWLDLLSSIPVLDAARWGRIARVTRVLRVLRAIRAARLLTTVVLRDRAQNSALAVSLIALLLIVFSSIAVLQFESGADSNIRTGGDAIWWAFVTMATVGYGDHFPVTTGGRVVAIVLMSAGVGLFGTFSAFLAAWFLKPDERAEESELRALREEIAALRATIEGRPQG